MNVKWDDVLRAEGIIDMLSNSVMWPDIAKKTSAYYIFKNLYLNVTYGMISLSPFETCLWACSLTETLWSVTWLST